MYRFFKVGIIIWNLFLLSCSQKKERSQKPSIQIAFMADVHLQDIYANFSDTPYHGIENPTTKKYNTIRTMSSQLQSTRLFNENYFAFIAALDDVAKKGVKIVALPGDFTDNGQPINARALHSILDMYTKKYGIIFLITTGNHDPVRPFEQESGKTDFLGENGKNQIIVSSKELIDSMKNDDLSPVITAEIKEWGYQQIMNELKDFGFFPKSNYIYWATPFSNYTYENYRLKKAKEEAEVQKRKYKIGIKNIEVPDASYVVEPIDGLWLLAIDANVYIPKAELSGGIDDPKNFGGASIGYANVLTQKKHLIDWVKKVAAEAKKRNKTLVAFSHYPIVEFNDGASEALRGLFGENKMQLERVPTEEVAQAFADAGLQLHFGGHMHMNDTGTYTTKKGNTLVNIQTPSLAGYIPAYKLLTITSKYKVEVETVIMDTVPKFRELFPLYEMEFKQLEQMNDIGIWNKEILKSKTYLEFTESYLKELIRLRFLPEDWPQEFREYLANKSGKNLLLLSKNEIDFHEVEKELKSYGLGLEDFSEWTGTDMIFDYYRIKLADQLVFNEIGEKRLLQYKLVCESLGKSGKEELRLWGSIFIKSMNGLPSNHFQIDLENNTIWALKE
tara:strand:+ start:15327 stop:17177 length:1851 start_codon:yes stop_codon:yes gene_type:complete